MTGHLSYEELVEALEDDAASHGRSRSEHLRECEACRARVREMEQTVHLVSDAEIPEPSPLYWEAFRRQVGRRLEEEGRPFAWRRIFLPGLTAVAAASLVIVSLVPWSHTVAPKAAAAPIPAWSALPEDDDTALTVLQGLGPSEDEVDAVAGGAGGVADRIVDLSEAESGALAASLRGEWEGRKP
ncbi:MAG: hypothetical protein ACHQNV_04395 [Vicinamibacteria bacterium]